MSALQDRLTLAEKRHFAKHLAHNFSDVGILKMRAADLRRRRRAERFGLQAKHCRRTGLWRLFDPQIKMDFCRQRLDWQIDEILTEIELAEKRVDAEIEQIDADLRAQIEGCRND